MNTITKIKFLTMDKSKYIKPITMTYIQNHKKKVWDLIKTHDSVAIIIFNVSKKTMLFVKQFRPAVYHSSVSNLSGNEYKINEEIDSEKFNSSLGITLELCSGIVDKNMTLEQVAKEEVFEECGYNVPLSNFERVCSYRSSPGITGSTQTLFYCEVNNEMKTSSGGGVNNELIEIVELTIPEVQSFMNKKEVNSPASLLSGVQWFFRNKY